jgi:hypothetical protein
LENNFLNFATPPLMCGGLGITIRVAAVGSSQGGTIFSARSQYLPSGWKWKPGGHDNDSELPPSHKKNLSHPDSSFTNPSSSHDGPGVPPPPPLLLPPLKNK